MTNELEITRAEEKWVASAPLATIENVGSTLARVRLYLRPDEAAAAIGVSRRTLSAWQAARVIPFRRVGRTVLISVADIQRALDRFTVAAVGEPHYRKKVETGTITTEPLQRKRRMRRITSMPPKE